MSKAKKTNALSEEERREKIRQGLLRKKESETKALKIVEEMIADNIEREIFREAAFYLNESYYNDIIDERNCMKICGYCLCSKELSNIPKQQYHISAKQNKVFDITERKKFCSSTCFKSSNFYKDQLQNSPLWMRDDFDATKVKLFDETSHTTQKRGDGKGLEIQMGSDSIQNNHNENANGTKISFSIDDMSNQLVGLDLRNCDIQKDINIDKDSTMQSEINNDNPCTNGILKKKETHDINKYKEKEINKGSSVAILTSDQVKSDKKKVLKNGNMLKKIEPVPRETKIEDVPPLIKVENFFSQWYTIDTLRAIKGDDFVRQILRENDCTVSNVVAAVGAPAGEHTFYDSAFREKYILLCRRLDLQDLEDTQWDKRELNNSTRKSDRQKSSKLDETSPLPSYDELRKNAEVDRLKIGSYFKGKTEYTIEDTTSDKKEKKVSEDQKEDDIPEPVLPLLDKHAQGALRRKIVHDQLERVIPGMLQLVGLLPSDVNEYLRKLVLSFELSANNVVLKTNEWTLVGIILLKMISVMDSNVAQKLATNTAKKYLSLLLLGYGTDLSYLETRISQFHADIHHLIQKMKRSS